MFHVPFRMITMAVPPVNVLIRAKATCVQWATAAKWPRTRNVFLDHPFARQSPFASQMSLTRILAISELLSRTTPLERSFIAD